MSQIQALLSVLRSQSGDELIVEAGASPQFFQRGQALKLFLRAVPSDSHAVMVGELADGEQRKVLAARGAVSFEHDAGSHGRFQVQLRGADGHRIRLVRLDSEGGEKARPEPVALAVEAAVEAAVAPLARPRARGTVEAPVPVEALGPVQALERVAPFESGPAPALAQLLDYAAERRASDLHLASGEVPSLRCDGKLLATGASLPDQDALLLGMLSPAERAELARGSSVDRAVQLASGARFRMNLYRCAAGLAAAFRVLRPAAPPLSRLKMPVDLGWITELTHGLVLFCGPTGSGKSTTMAALVRELLDRRGGLLITLEDPIEYTFEAPAGALVRQREIGRHVADFPTGLRDALREDPEVLLVGEMRDADSIQLALTAAETGHLVLASLHSRSAPAAVERIVDAYPPERQRQVRVQLADALRGVVSQRLVPRASGSGRTPAVEVLRINQAAAALIRDGKTPQLVSVIQTGAAEGMVTMDRCLRDLVAAGRIGPEHSES